MTPRLLGSTGVRLSPITFGAMRIVADRGGASSVLLHALERGVTCVDTARNYGESEAIVARTLREWAGPRPFLATKVKPRDIFNWRFAVPIEEQFTPASIVESVETSLRALAVEQIDLLQLHQWYDRWTDRDEWHDALDGLRRAGKVRFIGVSAQDHEHDGLLRLIDRRRVDAVQLLMNAFESRPLVSAVPLCHARGIGVIVRCVFDHGGALAGVATRESLAHDVKVAEASPEIVTEYLRRIERLGEAARAHGMDLVELGIRFALTHPGVTTIATSSSTAEHVDAAVAAAARGPLAEALFERVQRDHVWVKNFYYFSRSTVDGRVPQQ